MHFFFTIYHILVWNEIRTYVDIAGLGEGARGTRRSLKIPRSFQLYTYTIRLAKQKKILIVCFNWKIASVTRHTRYNFSSANQNWQIFYILSIFQSFCNRVVNTSNKVTSVKLFYTRSRVIVEGGKKPTERGLYRQWQWRWLTQTEIIFYRMFQFGIHLVLLVKKKLPFERFFDPFHRTSPLYTKKESFATASDHSVIKFRKSLYPQHNHICRFTTRKKFNRRLVL